MTIKFEKINRAEFNNKQNAIVLLKEISDDNFGEIQVNGCIFQFGWRGNFILPVIKEIDSLRFGLGIDFTFIIVYLLFPLFICCKNPEINGDKKSEEKAENISKELAKDTLIFTANADTLRVAKDRFLEISKVFTFINNKYPSNPDQSFYCNKELNDFDSEVGQDSYYTFYAHFLQKRNGIEKYSKQRNTLNAIFQDINSLYQNLQYGGTYFGHQYSRISGYVEYSLYLYSESQNNFEKTYNITNQKKYYIASLRQLIDDENTIDSNINGDEKLKRKQELNEIVNRINKSITNNFYLRRAQEFQSHHYEFY